MGYLARVTNSRHVWGSPFRIKKRSRKPLFHSSGKGHGATGGSAGGCPLFNSARPWPVPLALARRLCQGLQLPQPARWLARQAALKRRKAFWLLCRDKVTRPAPIERRYYKKHLRLTKQSSEAPRRPAPAGRSDLYRQYGCFCKQPTDTESTGRWPSVQHDVLVGAAGAFYHGQCDYTFSLAIYPNEKPLFHSSGKEHGGNGRRCGGVPIV